MTGGCKGGEGAEEGEGGERMKREGTARQDKQEQREHWDDRNDRDRRKSKDLGDGVFLTQDEQTKGERVGGRAYNLEAEEVTVGGVHCSVVCYDPTHRPDTHTQISQEASY